MQVFAGHEAAALQPGRGSGAEQLFGAGHPGDGGRLGGEHRNAAEAAEKRRVLRPALSGRRHGARGGPHPAHEQLSTDPHR